ncbi:putative protein OS=Tsukamurella paurometabola (strain ATCC 8368 / DSM / CCUG 35730 /CIP 100753 / JCM 10117 / KCTC 9821 / NBRC 16120 / NCIMB 702349/ NCTC 13040) OX=521096 GN=Tpau_0072 PE=4 SV=1 [Tsukamurella paurometabola]|uniref:Uncharacterized protein n=1 Tax=Tsukamurella paurometabola (strain ATCC 8368 / DSM 20162 / CCUG 35730 / CIP 100753 / JCM 10117 / KCTC 9821 / NBRC 16120 / NCIMB 702349 / NCTC 13040) TaxID=521096 RepID=D5UPV8_TSUPD|nr:hypothetical protein [Tsukamurella paurometabola]ADG76726.1 conserved hypothetical protein [Tsukamurella paurometabola DSM 20162]SUP41372.1 Uncharacterised protein [Tsukamurella paurometabola]
MNHAPADATTSSRSLRIWGWVGAAVALATSLVHLPMLGDKSWVVSIIVAAMLIGCAHCSVCLFRNPTVSAWVRTAAMGVIMIALHPVLMSAMGHGSGMSMDHAMAGMDMGGMEMGGMASMEPWMTLMIVFAAAEIVVAVAALGVIALRNRGTSRAAG